MKKARYSSTSSGVKGGAVEQLSFVDIFPKPQLLGRLLSRLL